jgi:photosystem II stability/assembly factor-like uncharacterized protein
MDRIRYFVENCDVAIRNPHMLFLILSLVLAACGPTAVPTTAPPATPTEVVAAATQTPTTIAVATTALTTTSLPTSTTQPTATSTPTPTATVVPPVTAAPFPTPTVSGASFTLEPDTAPPGTRVQGSGYLPGGPSAEGAKGNIGSESATVCWGACPGGLSEQDVAVQWSDTLTGQFTLTFTVPAIPWLGADGPHPLLPGDYAVGVQCLASAQPGCLLRGPQVGAVFHLVGPTPAECKQGPCGQLALSPSEGVPGTFVQVGGWAPLKEIIDNTPFGYSLLLESGGPVSQAPQITSVQQALDGSIVGSFRVPLAWPGPGLLQPGPYALTLQTIFVNAGPVVTETLPGGVRILPLAKADAVEIILAPATLTITAAAAWTSLGQVQPLLFQDSDRLYTSAPTVDVANPMRIAYCVPGGIQLSTDGGDTWSTISTAGVAQVAAKTSYPLFIGGSTGKATCHSVTLDPGHPESLYAVFETAKEPYGAPPVFFMGYLTSDGGNTWHAVPEPQGYTAEQFGGFLAIGGAVQALFAGEVPAAEQAPPFAVEQTADGGQSWVPAELTCPSLGPCIRWGPAPAQIGGMGVGYPQTIEISTDGGESWRTPAWPTQVTLNFGPSQLASFSGSTVALLSAGDDYPFRVSRDSGQTWEVIGLPALSGSPGNVPLYPALQMLPNGALLAQSQSGISWQMLVPGASSWCTVSTASLPSAPDLLTAIGNQLWWMESADTPNAAPVVQHVAVEDLKCRP